MVTVITPAWQAGFCRFACWNLNIQGQRIRLLKHRAQLTCSTFLSSRLFSVNIFDKFDVYVLCRDWPVDLGPGPPRKSWDARISMATLKGMLSFGVVLLVLVHFVHSASLNTASNKTAVDQERASEVENSKNQGEICLKNKVYYNFSILWYSGLISNFSYL